LGILQYWFIEKSTETKYTFAQKNTNPMLRTTLPAALTLMIVALLSGHRTPAPAPPVGNCSPQWVHADGYTFIRPDLIDSRSAYAPYLLDWGTFYRDSFDIIDWQKKENVEEWSERFCDLPEPQDVEDVVYHVSDQDLSYLGDLVKRKSGSTDLGFPFKDNSFAQCIVYNGCGEVVQYLKYARRCEQYVIAKSSKWRLQPDNLNAMQGLIRVGKQLMDETDSHFLKLRYAYHAIRLAHYAGQWQQTVDLFRELMPKVEQRKPSIVAFWALGHVAGALQRLGKYGEAAYRFSTVFRFCPSKRTQAFESFVIRDDNDWQTALRYCQNDAERATLYLMRAGKYRSTFLEDLSAAYEADPGNPQLTLMLVSQVQYFEKRLLRTPATDRRFKKDVLAKRQNQAASQLIDFQKFVRHVVKEGKVHDLLAWRCFDGYLEIIAKDIYAAEKTFQAVESILAKADGDVEVYYRQMEIWRTLAEINQLDTGSRFDYNRAAKIRSYKAFKDHPDLALYLQDMISEYYEGRQMTGLAILTVYGPNGVFYNPSVPVLEQMLLLARMGNEDFEQATAAYDTSSGRTQMESRLLELKGIALFNQGNPEAAMITHNAMRQTDQAALPKFSPFKESIRDGQPPANAIDSLQVSTVEFVRRMVLFEQLARANEVLNPAEAAKYYFLLGLGYYNTSWFGYEYEVRDFKRDGYNWNRLAQGPVFPLQNSFNGNRENLDLQKAVDYLEKALQFAGTDRELAAEITYLAARCQQKQWFCTEKCAYKPGNRLIPVVPAPYNYYYNLFMKDYASTAFGTKAVSECNWLKAYKP
jgi:hypothetical protein